MNRIIQQCVDTRKFENCIIQITSPYGKQLVVVPSGSGEPRAQARTYAIVVFCLAVAAALLVKVPALFGIALDENPGFYSRNANFFALPLLAGYFVWKRRLDTATLRWLAVAFVAAGVFANVYPFGGDLGGYTEVLTALHVPIALWLVVGIAYAGGRWGQVGGRMDFIRFSGELFIYFGGVRRTLRPLSEGRGSFTALGRWQTGSVPVYAVWAASVVIAFPPVFGYIW